MVSNLLSQSPDLNDTYFPIAALPIAVVALVYFLHVLWVCLFLRTPRPLDTAMAACCRFSFCRAPPPAPESIVEPRTRFSG